MSNKLPESCSIASFTSRNLAVCTYNCICMKGHDKDLASRMQMTDVKTITREQLRNLSYIRMVTIVLISDS